MCKDVGVLRPVWMLGASVTVMGLKRGVWGPPMEEGWLLLPPPRCW